MPFVRVAVGSGVSRLTGDIVRISTHKLAENVSGDGVRTNPKVNIRLAPNIARQLGLIAPKDGSPRPRVILYYGSGADHGRLRLEPADPNTPGALATVINSSGTALVGTTRVPLKNNDSGHSEVKNVKVDVETSPPSLTFDIPRNMLAA